MADLISNEGYRTRHLPSETSLRGYSQAYSQVGERGQRSDKQSRQPKSEFEDVIEVQPEEPEESRISRAAGLDFTRDQLKFDQQASTFGGYNARENYSNRGPNPPVHKEFAAAIYAHNKENAHRIGPGSEIDLLG